MQLFKYLIGFVVTLIIGLCISLPALAEVIRSYDIDLILKPDTALDITETITIDFGNSQRHGIFRIIPVQYHRWGNKYTVQFSLLSVTDEVNASLQRALTFSGGDVNIKIGNPSATVTGEHTYKIHYLVRRAVNFFNNKPEVYWNATGNDWPFVIDQASVRFYPPSGIYASDISTDSYVGSFGSREHGEIETGRIPIVFRATELHPGQGLTIVAGLPNNAVAKPNLLDQLIWFWHDWWPTLAIPLLVFSLMYTVWFWSGRDTGYGGAIAVEWNAPENLTPAEVGALVDERCDMQDIVSTLIDLAVRGYLKIQELSYPKFLFLSSKDYQFTKEIPANNTEKLLPHEEEFLNGLFADSDTVTLSSLKEKFYEHLPSIRNAIYKSLTDKHYFIHNPDAVRKTYRMFSFAIFGLAFLLLIFSDVFNTVSYVIAAVLSGLVVFIFAPIMPAKTAVGSKVARECLGFQRFLGLTEKERIKVMAEKDPTIFGRLLPFAMVLGAADQWANAFHGLLTQPPNWYIPSGYNTDPSYRFSPRLFVHDLGNCMNTASRTFVSAPSSSAGSGGSGFSGGFSGGGLGGGGGGSW